VAVVATATLAVVSSVSVIFEKHGISQSRTPVPRDSVYTPTPAERQQFGLIASTQPGKRQVHFNTEIGKALFRHITRLLKYPGIPHTYLAQIARMSSPPVILTRLEPSTLWSTKKFQRCSLCHITSDDVSGATKGITTARTVSKATTI
jgi:hypothetical protein